MVSPCKHTDTPAVSSVQQTALNNSGHSNPLAAASQQHPLHTLGVDPQPRLSPPTSIKSGDEFRDISAGVPCLSPPLSQAPQQHYHHPSPPGHSYPSYEPSMMLSGHSDAPSVSSATDNGTLSHSTRARSNSNLNYENDERWYQSRNTSTAPVNIASTESAGIPITTTTTISSSSAVKQAWMSTNESINHSQQQQHQHHQHHRHSSLSGYTDPYGREQNRSPSSSNAMPMEPTHSGNTTMMVTHNNGNNGNSDNGNSHHSSMSRDAATARRSSFTASYEQHLSSITSGEQMMTSDSREHAYGSNLHVRNLHNTATPNNNNNNNNNSNNGNNNYYSQRSPYASGSALPPPPPPGAPGALPQPTPSHASYASSPPMAGIQEQQQQQQPGYYRDHHDRRYQNAYMQQSAYAAPPPGPPPPPHHHHHRSSYPAARSPLDMPPNNTRSNYSHYGSVHSHEPAVTSGAPPPPPPPSSAAALAPSNVARSLGSESYNHSNPIPPPPYGTNHAGGMPSDRSNNEMGHHSLQAPATYATTFRVEEQQQQQHQSPHHMARRPRTVSFGGKPSSPSSPPPPPLSMRHSPSMGNNVGSSMIPSKRPASMLISTTNSSNGGSGPSNDMAMNGGMMPAVSPRPIPLVGGGHGQHSDDPGRMYGRDPSAYHRMMAPGGTSLSSSTMPFSSSSRPTGYQPLTPSQSGSLLPPNNAGTPTNSASARRAAQNRAAQRAFRQRKERYMKELEYKARVLSSAQQRLFDRRSQVKELQELARALFHENKRLRTRIDSIDVNKHDENIKSETDMNDVSSDTAHASSSSSSRLLASLSDAKIAKLLEDEPTNIDEDLIHPPTPSLPFPELDAVPHTTATSSSSTTTSATTTSASMMSGNLPPILSTKSES